MAITVGLDFGTHQTKICIEDTADKQNSNYSFWKFKDTDGRNQFVCPTVVQLNKDNTLSYGYVSDDNCKMGFHIEYPEPINPGMKEPILTLPAPPELYEVRLLDSIHQSTQGTITLKNIKSQIDKANSLLENSHRALCTLLKEQHKEEMKKYLQAKKSYELEYTKWQQQVTTPTPIRYFYFKQAVFSTFDWKYKDTSPILLSIWYIANIIFDLEEKYGQNFSIQMGIPTGAKDFQQKKQIATSILLSAIQLVEIMFHNDKEAFLASTIDELETLTDIIPYSDDAKQEYGILVFPEAYAGLRMMAARGKIVRGMNLNVDIGGGTTDISFFVIDKNRPHIYRYDSIPKGINWIIQNAFGDHSILKRRAFLDVNSASEHNRKAILESINKFYQEIQKTQTNIIKMLWSEWVGKMGTLNKYRLTEALQKRPIIYMGGGSTYTQLRKTVGDFSDVHIVNSEFWAGTQIEDVGNMCPILNTALGLSIGETNDNIEIYSISDLWGDVGTSHDLADEQVDYNLLDMN